MQKHPACELDAFLVMLPHVPTDCLVHTMDRVFEAYPIFILFAQRRTGLRGCITLKILAINGSHRGRKGFSQVLIDRLFTGARQAGASCETVVLAEYTIERCLACWACQHQGRLLPCVHTGKDDVSGIFKQMRQADLLVFATPIYIFNLSGLMKTFIERFCSTSLVEDRRLTKSGLFFHAFDRELFAKPIAVVIVCDNPEKDTYRSVVTYFKTYAKFLDIPIRGILTRRQGLLFGTGHDREKEMAFPKIADVYRAYEEAGKELALGMPISSSVQRRANHNVLPVPGADLLMKVKPIKRKMFAAAKKFRI
jgi:multimeric flavodoxin WrbA